MGVRPEPAVPVDSRCAWRSAVVFAEGGADWKGSWEPISAATVARAPEDEVPSMSAVVEECCERGKGGWNERGKGGRSEVRKRDGDGIRERGGTGDDYKKARAALARRHDRRAFSMSLSVSYEHASVRSVSESITSGRLLGPFSFRFDSPSCSAQRARPSQTLLTNRGKR